MSDRFQKTGCIALLVLACLLCIVPAVLQHAPVSGAVYTASSREAQPYAFPLPSGTVSVNSGNAEDLQMLPGIGETLSQLIISERLTNGDFYFPEDLTAVKGIGMKKLEQFRELLDFSQGGV